MLLGVAINILVIGPLAWIVKGAMEEQKKIRGDHEELREHVNTHFQRKSDHINELAEIKALIAKIFDMIYEMKGNGK